jgi:hypothetical protein
MGCLYYPQKLTSVSAAALIDPDLNPLADLQWHRLPRWAMRCN